MRYVRLEDSIRVRGSRGGLVMPLKIFFVDKSDRTQVLRSPRLTASPLILHPYAKKSLFQDTAMSTIDQPAAVGGSNKLQGVRRAYPWSTRPSPLIADLRSIFTAKDTHTDRSFSTHVDVLGEARGSVPMVASAFQRCWPHLKRKWLRQGSQP